MTPKRSESLERALRPAGGSVTDDELQALGAWARPCDGSQGAAWAPRVRELLAESPGRDLASAAVEARDEVVASSSGTAPRRREDGAGRASDGREPGGRRRAS